MIYDAIIIGSGIAGLSAGMKLPKDKNVLIVTKSMPWDCNTFYAQGGVAVAIDKDDIKSHIEDTILAGEGLCDIDAVELLCTKGKDEIQSLIDGGFWFDRDEEGNLLFTKEAAHSTNRILHSGGDASR